MKLALGGGHIAEGSTVMPTTGVSALRRGDSYTPACRIAGNTHEEILRAQTTAAGLVGAWGILMYGPAAAYVLIAAIVSALAADVIIGLSTRRPVVGGLWPATLTGLLLGLTLPATARWYIPVIGSMVAVIFAKALFGGLGHYIWQPALVGRVVVQLIFSSSLSLGVRTVAEPVLAWNHLGLGDLSKSEPVEMSSYRGWSETLTPPGIEAIKMERPVHTLRRFAEGVIKPEGKLRFEPPLRDALPPWEDTLLGAVPGGIGETGTLVLVVAGLYLIYRGYLRWQLPVSILASAALAAAIFPVESAGGGYRWLPVLAMENGRPAGLAYVLYHLTSGQLMLSAFLLAGDMVVSPKRARAQFVFGAAIGAAAMFMRLYGLLEAECYWPILGANTVVPFIDRGMKRRVLGINEE